MYLDMSFIGSLGAKRMAAHIHVHSVEDAIIKLIVSIW